jgi:O-antigen ligase
VRHAAMLWICALGVAIPQTRAAFFGLMLAGVVSLFCMGTLARAAFLAGTILTGLVSAFFVVYLPETGLSRVLSGYVTAIIGGAGLASDSNFYFRLMRWNAVVRLWLDNPIFGVGFGIPLVPPYLVQREEIGINSGLPHNTFLTTLARLGFFGLALVLVPWLHSFFRAVLNFRGRRYAGETLAAALMLICMLGYANFVLFLERPIHAAALWIVAAAACRLAGEAA